MRIVAKLALVLGVCFGGLGAQASEDLDRRGSGEGDWPLFCTIGGNPDYDAFLLRKENRSPSGYTLYFFAGGEVQSAVYPDVRETEDGQHLEVYGKETFGIFAGRDRHLLAYVAKSTARTSEAGIKTTIRGVGATFYTSDLHTSRCGQR